MAASDQKGAGAATLMPCQHHLGMPIPDPLGYLTLSILTLRLTLTLTLDLPQTQTKYHDWSRPEGCRSSNLGPCQNHLAMPIPAPPGVKFVLQTPGALEMPLLCV